MPGAGDASYCCYYYYYLVFDDSLFCASLSEYDSRHAHFHCYLQHLVFTESVVYLFLLFQLPVVFFFFVCVFVLFCVRSSLKYWYLQYIWPLVRFLKLCFHLLFGELCFCGLGRIHWHLQGFVAFSTLGNFGQTRVFGFLRSFTRFHSMCFLFGGGGVEGGGIITPIST